MHLAGMNRYQAFGIHFGISLMIFIGLVAMVLFVWYPGVLREVDSSWQQALIMIAGVDLVLGPLLTLIVFNPVKKSLKMDLSVIAVAQIAALVAGTYTVHQARPVALYVSFPAAGFETLTASQVTTATLQHIQTFSPPVFYYSGPGTFGPQNTRDIKPNQLKPTLDPGFTAFLSNNTPEHIYKKDERYVLDIPDPGRVLTFDLKGRILGIQEKLQH